MAVEDIPRLWHDAGRFPAKKNRSKWLLFKGKTKNASLQQGDRGLPTRDKKEVTGRGTDGDEILQGRKSNDSSRPSRSV